jgi:hypothetical protein
MKSAIYVLDVKHSEDNKLCFLNLDRICNDRCKAYDENCYRNCVILDFFKAQANIPDNFKEGLTDE